MDGLAWLLILATIPVGITGLLAEHWFRTTLAKPNPTAVFLMVNGALLIFAERLRRRDTTVDSTYGHANGQMEQAAAETDNGIGRAGLCPRCLLLPVVR